MRLESISLTNFRQFFGRQEAEFSTSPRHNVTVFHGLNGAGKTSLFTAINWCLYGAAAENIGELVSKEALSRVSDGATVVMRVEVGFVNKGDRYSATRSLTVRKHGKAGVPVGLADFTLTQFKASGDNELIRNPIQRMNYILPANVRPYFFFDGEKMDDLTRAESKEVKDAIRNIMRLPSIERAERHLTDIAREYRGEIKRNGSPELEKMISKEDYWRGEKEKTQRRRDELKDEIRIAQQQVDDVSAQLRGSDAAKPLQRRRDDIQNELQRLEQQHKNDLSEIQKVINRSYLQLLSEPAAKALGLLDQKREKGEVPSNIRETLVNDLLHNLKCICGRSFDEGDAAYTQLKSLMKTATTNKMASEVINLAGNLRTISNTTANQASYLNRLVHSVTQIKTTQDQLQREFDEIREQLKDITEDNIAGLERKRGEFQRQWQRCITEQAKAEADLVNYDKYIVEISRLKLIEEAKQKKLGTLTECERLAQKGADAVAQLKNDFFEETREEVEATTQSVFEKLAWKQEHFQGVSIDSDFQLEVMDRWGTPTREELSAGERQILSLSFICAMSQVSGEEAPLVMDTPFGRLSGNHLSAVARNLPELSSQLILFVTDREWDASSREGLAPRTGRQYKLNFDSSTGCTTIEEID